MVPRHIRVLIADDHRMFRETLRRWLDGHSEIEIVGEAANGEEVVELVSRIPADVLLLDLTMPGMSGLDALKRLSESNTRVRTILLTGTAARHEVIQAIQLGARGVVVKDASVDLLVKSILQVAAGHYWIGHDRVADVLESVAKKGAKTGPQRPVDTLTRREVQIIEAVMQGATNKDIAGQFSLSEQTVKNHLSGIFDKLGVANRLELALYAVHHRIISGGE